MFILIFSVIYKPNKNLKVMVAPSLYLNLASKVIVLLLVVTNVTFIRTFWLQIISLDVQ